MKHTNTKKALALSLLSMLLCVSMLVGSTFAWFTDTATTGVNTIVAGNLDIELSYKNANGTDFAPVSAETKDLFVDADGNEMLWEPGAVSVCYFKLENLGTLALQYKLSVSYTDTVTYVPAEGEEVKLSNALKSAVVELADENAVLTRATAVAAAEAEAVKALGHESAATTMRAGADARYFALVIYMPTTVDNTYNLPEGAPALKIQLGVNLVATQVSAELDSFGDTYDNNAVFPDLPKQVNVNLVSDPITAGSATTIKTEDEAVKFDIPADAVTAGTKVKAVVTTTASTANSITYNIDLKDAATDNDIDIAEGKPITVTMNIGKGLVGVAVTHNGNDPFTEQKVLANIADGEYHYDPASGILTICSDEFSPYEITYTAVEFAASIGSTGYTDLAEALAAAKAGDVIALGGDVTVDSITIDNGGTYTLDLAGHKLTVSTTTNDGIVISNGSALNIKNTVGTGTIEYLGTNTKYDAIYANGADLTLSGKIDLVVSPKANSAIHNVGTSVVTFGEGVSIISQGETNNQFTSLYIERGATVNMNGGSILVETNLTRDDDGWNNDAVGAMMLGSGCAFNMNGGSITVHSYNAMAQAIQTATYNGAGNSTATINGGTFDIANEGDRVASVAFGIFDPSEGQIIVNDAVFTGKYESVVTTYYSGTPDITINGGSYIFDPSEYLGEGKAVKQADGMYEVVELPGGKMNCGYVSNNNGVATVWGELYADPSESLYVEVYSGEVKLATVTLNDVDDIYAATTYSLTWHGMIVGEEYDTYWTTAWTGPKDAEHQPTKVVLYVDGFKISEDVVYMSAPDGLNPVVWSDIITSAN